MSDEPRKPDAVGPGAPSESKGEGEAVYDAPGRRTREVDLGPLPRRLGRYEVLAAIGSGGMGTVFRARQVQMDRIVALKVLAPELARDKRYLKRFVREARAAGSLDHPNIVHVHDVARASGHPYICMEHVDGTSVERMLRRRGRLSPNEAVGIAIDVAKALACAHRAGIVHRDVKPDNILVDRRGIVKLTDLGLARRPASGGSEYVTRQGMGVGTPHYVAIEQARDARRADGRSDIYSLGATLYHMVTGRIPFEGDSPVDILMHAAEDPLVSPAELVRGLPETLVSVIERMLAKDPRLRYQDAPSVRADLEQVRNELAGLGPASIAGGPANARPPEGPGRMLVEVAAALALLVLAAALALALGSLKSPPPPEPLFEVQGEPEGGRAGTEAHTSAAAQGGARATARPGGGSDGTRAGGRAPVLRPAAIAAERAGVREARRQGTGRPVGKASVGERAAPTGRPEESSAEPTLADALRRSRWSGRAGRYGEAAAALRAFAAKAEGEDPRREALVELEVLYARAEMRSADTLATAAELIAAGRNARGIRFLEWVLDAWGLPVLEARAEDALRTAREAHQHVAAQKRVLARAEANARQIRATAENLARRRCFKQAARKLDEAIMELEDAAEGARDSSLLEGEFVLRRRAFEALTAVHRAILARFAPGGFRVSATEIFPDWAKDAMVVAADVAKVRIELPGVGNYVEWPWGRLSARQYARLAVRCHRPDRREEVLGAGLALIEAGMAKEALELWKGSRASRGASVFVGRKAKPDAASDALRRARKLDESGRECQALAALAALFELGDAPRDEGGRLRRFVRSLARDADASCGISASPRPGPGDAEELFYDFSRDEWRGDWRVATGRLRQAEHAAVSPSGGACRLEFAGAFVSPVEVACSVRLLEEAVSGVEVAFADKAGAGPEARSWVSAEELARGAPATLLPLVKRPLDVVFSRSWGESSFRLARPSGAAGGRVATKRAAAPRGPERVVVTLTGWVELRSVRLRGVVDPDWRKRVRAERTSRAEKALARAFGERDAARRAKALEGVRARYPDCRVVGLRATRGAAKAYLAAGNRSRSRAAEALARFWYPEFDAAAPGKDRKKTPGPQGRRAPTGK